MSFFAVLMGGLVGLSSFFVALFAYDWSFVGALGIYSFVGILATLTLIAISLINQAMQRTAASKLPVLSSR